MYLQAELLRRKNDDPEIIVQQKFNYGGAYDIKIDEKSAKQKQQLKKRKKTMGNKALKQFGESKYLKLEDGVAQQAVFMSGKIVKTKFGREAGEYEIQMPNGALKTWTTGAKNVADVLGDLEGGENILITRKGIGTATEYEVEVLSESEDVFVA